jgi:hypothetical protein
MRLTLLVVALLAALLVPAGGALAAEGDPVEGTAFSRVVATFDAPPPKQVTIDWGDGQTQPSAVTTRPDGKGEVSATHTYAHFGSYTVTTTDKDAPSTSQRLYLTVTDAPISAEGTTFKVAAAPAGVVVATVVDTNASGTAADLSARIDWGDGTSADGVLTPVAGQPGRYEVRGAHTYPDAASYIAEIAVKSTGNGDAKAAAQSTADGAPEPSPAAKGRILDLGPGDAPSMVVDEAGTAHLVWNVSAPGRTGDAVVYCRLPRGARACAVKRRLVVDALTDPVILRDRTGVLRIVVSYNGTAQIGGGTLVVSSADDAATFGYAFYRVNTGLFQGRIIDAELSPDGRRLYALFGDFVPGDKLGQIFATIGLDRPVLDRVDDPGKVGPLGPDPSANRKLIPYSARALAILPDGRVAMAGYDTEAKEGKAPRAAIRVIADAEGRSLTTPWTPIRSGEVQGLAGNERGTALLASKTCQQGLEVSSLRGLRVGAPRPLTADRSTACNAAIGASDLSFDPAGGRHAVWLSDEDGCQGKGAHEEDEICIVYRRARPGGDFGPKSTISTLDYASLAVRVGAGRDGEGWIAWRELVPTKTGSIARVRVTPTLTDSEDRVGEDHRIALTFKPGSECAKDGPVTVGVQVAGPAKGRPRVTRVAWATTLGLLPRRQRDGDAPVRTRLTVDRRQFRGLSSTGVIVFKMTVRARVTYRVGSGKAKTAEVHQVLSFFCGIPFSKVRRSGG